MKRQTYTQHVSYELSDGKATPALGVVVVVVELRLNTGKTKKTNKKIYADL